MFKQLSKKKGVAGLSIFLELIALLFVIGILVMAFMLSGSRISSQLNATTDAAAIASIAATTTAIGTASNWFSIFITIGAIVVLVLLILLIIVSLKGAGMIQGGQGGA